MNGDDDPRFCYCHRMQAIRGQEWCGWYGTGWEYAANPLWHKEWEVLGDGANTACRGDHDSDAGGNATHGHLYELHAGVLSLSQCRDLCLAEGANCTGIEFNQDHQRCEVWTRAEGIGAWATPEDPGFTCQRYGWPAKYLHPADEGEGRVCRASSPDDNSEDYYELYSAATLEECKARCVVAPVCAGLEFNANTSRCEVWTKEIQATSAQDGFTCLRYDPSLPPVQPSTTFTTSPSATVSVYVYFGRSDQDRKCVTQEGVITCTPSVLHYDWFYDPYYYEAFPELILNITVEGDQVCAVKVAAYPNEGLGWWDRGNFRDPGVQCLARAQ